jgi:hypothetical protein
MSFGQAKTSLSLVESLLTLKANCNLFPGVILKKDKPETIIEKCDRYREEAKKFYKNFEDEKEEQERFYKGDHWKDKNPANRPKNHIFQIVESEIPLLMDPMPSTDILAHDEEKHGEQALVLEAAKDHVYRQQNLFLKDTIMIRQALKTGAGYQWVDFDPDGENGEGSITVKNVSRKMVLRDPSAETIDDARYVIYDEAMSSEDMKRRYPETYEEACHQPLKDLYVFAGSKGSREDQNIGYGSGKEANRYDSKDMSFVEHFFLKDYTMEEIPDDETQIQLTEESAELMNGINPDISKWEDHAKHIEGHSEQKLIIASEALQMPIEAITEADLEALKQDPEIALRFAIIDDHIEMHQMYIDTMSPDEVNKRPKYPHFLRQISKTGKVVHFDGAPDVEDGLIPLVELECYKDEGPAEGIVKNLIPLQKTINEMDSKELKGLKVSANPGWLVDEESGVDPDTLTDEDGIVVTKKAGTEAMRLPPGQVSNQLQNRSMRDYEAMQRIEGVGEAVFGEGPKSQTSGVMYRRMQQQSLGRIRLKTKMLESAIYRRDLLITSRIMSKWSAERLLRTEDANGKIRFITFDPRAMKDFTYDLSFPSGTTVGVDKETIAETYKELLLAGAIDLKMYAQLTDIPKKQELLDMLDQKDQVAMQAQELQAQNQELQKQMLMMKANLAPQSLTPEEVKAVEALAMEEQQAAMTQNPLTTPVE